MVLEKGLLRVPWTASRSNQSILKEINPEYSLEGLMLKLKLQYLGYHAKSRLIRKESESLWGERMRLFKGKLAKPSIQATLLCRTLIITKGF